MTNETEEIRKWTFSILFSFKVTKESDLIWSSDSELPTCVNLTSVVGISNLEKSKALNILCRKVWNFQTPIFPILLWIFWHKTFQLLPSLNWILKLNWGISAGLQEFNQLIQVYQPGTSGTKYMDYG